VARGTHPVAWCAQGVVHVCFCARVLRYACVARRTFNRSVGVQHARRIARCLAHVHARARARTYTHTRTRLREAHFRSLSRRFSRRFPQSDRGRFGRSITIAAICFRWTSGRSFSSPCQRTAFRPRRLATVDCASASASRRGATGHHVAGGST
jgi:hypothetical protein